MPSCFAFEAYVSIWLVVLAVGDLYRSGPLNAFVITIKVILFSTSCAEGGAIIRLEEATASYGGGEGAAKGIRVKVIAALTL